MGGERTTTSVGPSAATRPGEEHPPPRPARLFGFDETGWLLVECPCGARPFLVERTPDWRTPSCPACSQHYAIELVPVDG